MFPRESTVKREQHEEDKKLLGPGFLGDLKSKAKKKVTSIKVVAEV
jgi:hypothetical protein